MRGITGDDNIREKGQTVVKVMGNPRVVAQPSIPTIPQVVRAKRAQEHPKQARNDRDMSKSTNLLILSQVSVCSRHSWAHLKHHRYTNVNPYPYLCVPYLQTQ
jgi:hypothetical protein